LIKIKQKAAGNREEVGLAWTKLSVAYVRLYKLFTAHVVQHACNVRHENSIDIRLKIFSTNTFDKTCGCSKKKTIQIVISLQKHLIVESIDLDFKERYFLFFLACRSN
jgi:hypothetical protein